MARTEHDVVVVGGGVHGACAAWEAARRGQRVALVEAVDFGHATTSNSLRTFHGGIRYLQQLDFRRMRESIRERREWLRLAPHLIRPMRFVLPTTGHGMRGPEIMGAALIANDVMSADRNRGVRPDRALPRGELWSAARVREVLAGTALQDINGAAAWYDAVCTNTERLQIGIVAAAAAAGAQVANYVRMLELRRHPGGVHGVRVRDELGDVEYELRARVVINAAGPAVDETLTAHGHRPPPRLFTASRAFNLLTRPLPFADAVALSCARLERDGGILDKGTNTYFVIPWNGRSLIGTRHLRCEPSARTCAIEPEEVQAFLRDINGALGKHRVAAADVTGIFCGLLPEEAHGGSEVALSKTARVIDHGVEDDLPGVYSIVGIKWTTARAVAERAVTMACKRLGTSAAPAAVRTLSLFPRATDARPRVAPECLQHLVEMYGANASAVQGLIAVNPALSERVVSDLPVTQAQIVYATRSEMACRLWDVVRRRAPLYLSDELGERGLATCAALMQRELGWSRLETSRQIEATAAQWRAFREVSDRGPGSAAQAGKAAPLPAETEGDVRKSAAGDFCQLN